MRTSKREARVVLVTKRETPPPLVLIKRIGLQQALVRKEQKNHQAIISAVKAVEVKDLHPVHAVQLVKQVVSKKMVLPKEAADHLREQEEVKEHPQDLVVRDSKKKVVQEKETDLLPVQIEVKEHLQDLAVLVSKKKVVQEKETDLLPVQTEVKEHLQDLVVLVSKRKAVQEKEIDLLPDPIEVKDHQDLAAVPEEQVVSGKKAAKVPLIKENLLLTANRKELQKVLAEVKKQKIQKKKQILVLTKMNSLEEQVLVL